MLWPFQRSGELVGAGGGLEAAVDALQPVDDLVDVHALNQAANALKIAVAAAGVDDVVQLVIDDLKVDVGGTGALGAVIEFHGI